MTNQNISTQIAQKPYIELTFQGKLLVFELGNQQHKIGRDYNTADLVVPSNYEVVGRCQAVLRRQGEEYYIYDGDGQKPSTNGLYINHTRLAPNTGFVLENGVEINIGQGSQKVVLKYFTPQQQVISTPPKQKSVSLNHSSVSIGRDNSANLTLDAPTISRRHAVIYTNTQGNYVLQDYSTNGVFINGQRVNKTAILPQGASIRIGSYTLVLRGDQLEVVDQGNQIRLDVRDVVLETNGKRRIDDVSFPIQPGQFVALVGGSGAGKSTLMRTLLGTEQITKGVVYLNGEDLRRNFNMHRTNIGYVPQDDIIHRELTVAEVLFFAAKLRLPPDTDVKMVVEQTLKDVEMLHRRNARVSDLSGGQRKRVSIGVELLADPKLFFLDEPTSGLDPGLDKKMMQLLRKLADQGRTVILVTHATANIKLCDRVVFLGQGGRLCYFGPPDRCLQFFSIKDDFADIYNLLEKPETVVDQAQRFYTSNDYQQYVTNYLSRNSQTSQVHAGNQQKSSSLQQLNILTQRYFQSLRRDYVNLALALLTAPIGISLITLVLQGKQPLIIPEKLDFNVAFLALRVLLVFTCAALWVGLSSSLQEIVKETAIYLRERLVNLGLFAYLSSKLTVLSGLAILQTLLMSVVILTFFTSPQSRLISWQLGLSITTFLTLITSMSLGLLVSAIVKNVNQANSTLPLLLIPQIIFSGVLFDIKGISRGISWLMLSRWSIGAYGSLVNINAMIPEAIKLPDGRTIPRPFEPNSVYDATLENLSLNWGLLCLHTIIYLSITLWLQKRKDIFS